MSYEGEKKQKPNCLPPNFEFRVPDLMAAERKFRVAKCFMCDWSGESMFHHLRRDHLIAATLAPHSRPLDWSLDITKRLDEEAVDDSEGKRWSILIGVFPDSVDEIPKRAWFLLSAEQEWVDVEGEEKKVLSDWQFQLRSLDGSAYNRRFLGMMKYAGPGYQGLWTWLTPEYTAPAHGVLLPAQLSTVIPDEGTGEHARKTLRIVILIRPVE